MNQPRMDSLACVALLAFACTPAVALAETHTVISSIPVDINDFQTSSMFIVVSDSFTITDVNVTIGIQHTFDGDLEIVVRHPNGLGIPLCLGRGGSGDDFRATTFDDEAAVSIASGSAPFRGSFQPEVANGLSALDGEDANGTWALEVEDTAGGDVGQILCFSLAFNGTTTVSTDVPVNIVDNAQVQSLLTVTDSFTVADVDVTVDIDHTWDNDLVVRLHAPDGTFAELFSNIGGDGDNFHCTSFDDESPFNVTVSAPPFRGRWKTEAGAALSPFDGVASNGVWQLVVEDQATQDTGTLNDWWISLQPSAVSPPANDDCANAVIVNEAGAAFDTAGATDDGPAGCNVTRDIWFRYTPFVCDTVTVSLCGSAFDTALAVYEGTTCQPTNLVACNDDFCGTQSEVTFVPNFGSSYLIRIGSPNGTTGSGTLSISCNDACEPDCSKQNIECLNPSPQYDNRRAVVQIRIEDPPGVFLAHCTGWMIGDPDCLITNEHCLRDAQGTPIDVTKLRAFFDYECDACTGGTERPTTMFSVQGLIHANAGLDYALFDLAGNPAATYGTLTVSQDLPTVGAGMYEIHHGGTKVKGYDTGTYTGIFQPGSCLGSTTIEVGVSAVASGGASGSPVFSSTTHAVEAICHCGPNCAAGFAVPMSAIVPDALPHIQAHGCTVNLLGGSAAANDPCGSPTPVTGLPFTDVVDTSGASADGPVPTCGANANGSDVWYQFTPALTCTYRLQTCGSDHDTVVQVYTGSCGGLSPVAGGCNNDGGCGVGGSVLDVVLSAGVPTIIQVGHNNAGSGGTLAISIDELDSDSDGTPDCNDGCPTDPNKTAPGACGCGVADTDSDSDGTPDCNDGCPNDPDKTAPGICGCGVADTDSDSDGTPDCNDGCPNDPDKTSPGVCGCGVADTDSDSDGTPDCNDGCPNDPNKTSPGQCGCGVPEGCGGGGPKDLARGEAPLLFSGAEGEDANGTVLRDGQFIRGDEIWLWVPAINAGQVDLSQTGQFFKIWDSGPEAGPDGNDDDDNGMRGMDFVKETGTFYISYEDSTTTGFAFGNILDGDLMEMTPTAVTGGTVTGFTLSRLFSEGVNGTAGILGTGDLNAISVAPDGTYHIGLGGAQTIVTDVPGALSVGSSSVVHMDPTAASGSPENIGPDKFFEAFQSGGGVIFSPGIYTGQLRGVDVLLTGEVTFGTSGDYSNTDFTGPIDGLTDAQAAALAIGVTDVCFKADICSVPDLNNLSLNTYQRRAAEALYDGSLFFQSPNVGDSEILDHDILDSAAEINALITILGETSAAGMALRDFADPVGGCGGPGDGDVNGDGFTNGADIGPFTELVVTGSGNPPDPDFCASDLTGDGAVDTLDVSPMVSALLQ